MTPSQQPAIWRSLIGGSLGPLLSLVAVILFFALVEPWMVENPRFLTMQNFRTSTVQMSGIAVAALGMMLIIISGGIDLSAGTALAFSATTLAWFLREGYGVPAALLAGIGTGAMAGLINGVLISCLRVVPFIVTLGTMTAYLGWATIIAEETTVRPNLDQIPEWIPQLVSIRPDEQFLVASGVWLALALALLTAAVLRYTVFGRYVFAVGSNESTARLCGVPVTLVKVAVYTISGVFVGIAGVYQFARLTNGNPSSGAGLELKIIAAVVIGGASLSGGRGTVLGTFAGAAIMQTIASGCSALGLSNPLQNIIIGAIIIAAATLDQWRQRRLAA